MSSIKDKYDKEIEELTKRRDELLAELEEIERKEKRKHQIIAQRSKAMRDTERPFVYFRHLPEEYQDTIYMERPYVVEINADICFGKAFEEGFLQACQQTQRESTGLAPQYVVYCRAVSGGNEPHLFIEDPFKHVEIVLREGVEMPEGINPDDLVEKMLVVRLEYYPYEDRYELHGIKKILDEPFRENA